MSQARFTRRLALTLTLPLLSASALGLVSCNKTEPEPEPDVTLVLAAYSATRDVFERGLLPAFEAHYLARTGKRLRVRASYLASGAQSRAVASGFPADVVALALAPDIARIQKAGLIKGDVRAHGKNGSFATTIVALAVRPGNPKGIHDIGDLARPGLEVLMPNPKTSGGAMWNVSALWAAAMGGHAGFAANDRKASEDWLRAVLANVVIMDKAARESLISFEKGVGDVAVTYESEVFAGRAAGRTYDLVIPTSTIIVTAMAAVVDVNADKHGVRAEADAFVDYLSSKEAQDILATYGFRSEDLDVARAHERDFPAVVAPVRIEDLGGWERVTPELFGNDGIFAKAWDRVYAAP